MEDKFEALERFIKDGRFTVFPKKQQVRQLVFEYLMAEIAKQGQFFTEKQINEIIKSKFGGWSKTQF